MKSKVYHETLIARALPWGLFQIICVLALMTPLLQTSRLLNVIVLSILGLATVALFRAFFIKPPVLILEERGIVLRGVEPGAWKLFQRWVTDIINDKDITSIRIGYIREKRFGLKLPPMGVPSKYAMFQMFLWIKYDKDGKEMELYYPHLKNIKHYKDLLEYLRSRFGSKCEEWL